MLCARGPSPHVALQHRSHFIVLSRVFAITRAPSPARIVRLQYETPNGELAASGQGGAKTCDADSSEGLIMSEQQGRRRHHSQAVADGNEQVPRPPAAAGQGQPAPALCAFGLRCLHRGLCAAAWASSAASSTATSSDGEVRGAAELRRLGDTWGEEAEAAFSVERRLSGPGRRHRADGPRRARRAQPAHPAALHELPRREREDAGRSPGSTRRSCASSTAR